MRLLSWIILLPVALAVAVFSVVNRESVALDLWPLPFTAETPVFVPVFVIVLFSVFVGFVWGGVVTWISAAGRRRRAIARRVAGSEKEVEELKERLRDRRIEGP